MRPRTAHGQRGAEHVTRAAVEGGLVGSVEDLELLRGIMNDNDSLM